MEDFFSSWQHSLRRRSSKECWKDSKRRPEENRNEWRFSKFFAVKRAEQTWSHKHLSGPLRHRHQQVITSQRGLVVLALLRKKKLLTRRSYRPALASQRFQKCTRAECLWPVHLCVQWSDLFQESGLYNKAAAHPSGGGLLRCVFDGPGWWKGTAFIGNADGHYDASHRRLYNSLSGWD